MYAFGLSCWKIENQLLKSIESKVEPAPRKATPPAGTLVSAVFRPEDEQPVISPQSTTAIKAGDTLTASECVTFVRIFCLHLPTGTSNAYSASGTLGI